MLNWTDNVPEGTRDLFFNILQNAFGNLSEPSFLEVGTYTGTSVAYVKSTFPNTKCVAIDNWGLDHLELNSCAKYNGGIPIERSEIKQAFLRNNGESVELIEADSAVALSKLVNEGRKFDFIYVDGSHIASDVLMDLTLSWLLLNDGGTLAIDDYEYTYPENPMCRVKAATDYFMEKFSGQYEIVSKHYRMFLKKTLLE